MENHSVKVFLGCKTIQISGPPSTNLCTHEANQELQETMYSEVMIFVFSGHESAFMNNRMMWKTVSVLSGLPLGSTISKNSNAPAEMCKITNLMASCCTYQHGLC